MQLTRFTDLGLRVLMYLSGAAPETVTTIAEITERFDVPHNHLAKVVQFMGQQGWLRNVRGKGGGVALALALEEYPLGHLVRTLERSDDLIDCTQPPCALKGRCSLKGLLNDARDAFYAHLDQYTLADAVAGPTDRALLRLHRARPATPSMV
jgi:Rrf2 family transcriptional regulator, nitric oxide-sensitive transcriptional repressor